MLVPLVLSFFPTTFARADLTPLAKCASLDGSTAMTVALRTSESVDWRSVDVAWTKDGVTYEREFINREIKQLDDDAIRAIQNHVFLFFGSKTRFTLDLKSRTAELSGRNMETLVIGGGPHAPSEKKGKFEIRFGCDLPSLIQAR